MISRVQKVYEVQLIRCIEKMNRVNFMGLVITGKKKDLMPHCLTHR